MDDNKKLKKYILYVSVDEDWITDDTNEKTTKDAINHVMEHLGNSGLFLDNIVENEV